jgi:hypothetical protein
MAFVRSKGRMYTPVLITYWKPPGLHAVAKLIQHGDFICLLQGTSKSSIIGSQEDYYVIIIIAAVPPEFISNSDHGDIEWAAGCKVSMFHSQFFPCLGLGIFFRKL